MQENKDFEKTSLTPEDEHTIRFELKKMFFGFVKTNWVNGKLLGSAREEALRQVKAFAASRKSNNAAVRYMHRVILENTNGWARMIVAGKRSKQQISCPPESLKAAKTWGAQTVNEAMVALNQKIAKFNTVEKPTEKSVAQVKHEPKVAKEPVIIEMKPVPVAAPANPANTPTGALVAELVRLRPLTPQEVMYYVRQKERAA